MYTRECVPVPFRECFPADMVLLATSDGFGVAYIETANLDGETNLKLKQAHQSNFHQSAMNQPLVEIAADFVAFQYLKTKECHLK